MRLVALILVLAMWPAAGETVELVVHVTEHGDLAHGGGDTHDSAPFGGDREHGCSSTFHLCGAASSAPVRAPIETAPVAQPCPAHDHLIMPGPATPRGLDDPTPPIRPPIA